MKLTRKALALGFAVAAVSVAACSSQQGSGSGTNGSGTTVGSLSDGTGNTGSVGLHLNIPNSSFTIGSLNWTITNGANTYTGTINMTDDAGNAAQSIEFVAGPVVAGPGYTVTLTGSDSNGDPCTGTSPPFTVSAGTSTTATAVVNIQCTVPTDASVAATVDSGSVAVDAGVTLINQSAFLCPGITGVSISPAELKPPETAALNAGIYLPPAPGGTETLTWSATCGTGAAIITNPNAANTTFSCGTAINTLCTLTLTVGLNGTAADGGTVGQVCTGVGNTTISESINCEPGGATLPGCPTGFTQCGTTATDCEDLSNGSGPNGLCGTACGTAVKCSGTTPACQAGVCVAQPPTACTTAPCAASGPNSLKCTGNGTTGTNAGVCTPTQAILMGLSQACYTCAQSNFCLDNASQSGFECQDLAGTFVNGAGATVNQASTCETTLTCVTGSQGMSCPSNANGIGDCYCGPSLTPSACQTATTQNGPCLADEIAGFAYTPGSTAANTILGEFTTQTTPSGNANALAACALSNCASTCGTLY
jgi:hypothetical protein